MCGEVEGLVSVERWSCSRGASCVVEYSVGRLRDHIPLCSCSGLVLEGPVHLDKCMCCAAHVSLCMQCNKSLFGWPSLMNLNV